MDTEPSLGALDAQETAGRRACGGILGGGGGGGGGRSRRGQRMAGYRSSVLFGRFIRCWVRRAHRLRKVTVEQMEEQDNEGAFLSAIHFLIQRRSRTAETDLLLAAITHALDDVALRINELTDRVSLVWPGASTSQDEVERVCSIGRELGLLVKHEDLQGGDEWMLTQRGADDVAVHRAWASDIRRQNAAQLADRASDALSIELGTDVALLWLDALIRALVVGIQHAQDAYSGNIEQLVSGAIRPRSIDRELVLESLGAPDSHRTEFLRALALSAIDPLDPFGNDIVSYITTGCILHSVVAQSARVKVNRSLGDAAGERVFLDTPCLLELLHVERVSHPMELAVRSAIAQGWEVHVLEHSLDELRDVLRRTVETLPLSFRQASTNGAREEWLATLVDDQVASMYIEARQSGLYGSLDEFGRAGDLLERKLGDLGVSIRPAMNEDRAEVKMFVKALSDHLSVIRRSSAVIERDAETMAAAARRRRRQRTQKRGSKWPGCWVVTTDRRMGPAYSAVTNQRVTLTLTPSQWSRLLATCSTSTDILDLAAASADQWIEEAMWSIPVRFPPAQAAALARSLSPEAGGSITDMRVAQLTLEQALESPDATDASLAAEVLERRVKRRDSTTAIRLSAADSEVESHRLARLSAEKDRAEALTREGQTRAEALRTSGVMDELQRELVWQRTRTRRIVVSFAAVTVGVATLVWAGVASSLPVVILSMTSLIGIGIVAFRWCSKQEERLLTALLGGGFQALATVVTLADYFDLWRLF